MALSTPEFARMSRSKRNSPQGADQREHWLGAEQPGRSRPWAYEELLFGSVHERERRKELGALMEDLAREQDELSELHGELDEHLARIAALQGRLDALTPETGESRTPPPPDTDHEARTLPARERSYSLARCEGFKVDSPVGPVGFVEGLRFGSRIDQPDLLEVRGGRFGRRLLLIPVEDVDEIRPAEERLVVRSTSRPDGDLLHELALRLRRALSFGH